MSCAPAWRRTSAGSRPWSSEFVFWVAIRHEQHGQEPDEHDGADSETAPSAGLSVADDAGDAAIRALEASEDRGLKHYLDDVCKLDHDTRNLVAREILPEQVRTYDSLSDLKLTRRLL